MIPYFGLPGFQYGPIYIDALGVLIAAAICLAVVLIQARARTAGIDGNRMLELCLAMLLAGFLGANLLKTVVPQLSNFLEHPVRVLVHSRGIASLGGLGGGLLGGVLWNRLRGESARASLQMFDVIAFALPFAWCLGRLGCFLVHDHRGLITSSWVAVRFPEGTRYDLGLVEFLFLIGLSASFQLLDCRPRAAGFFFGLFGVAYGAFRIWLDTLHVQPLRFLGGATAVLVGLAGWVAMRSLRTTGRGPEAPPADQCGALSMRLRCLPVESSRRTVRQKRSACARRRWRGPRRYRTEPRRAPLDASLRFALNTTTEET